MSMFEPGGELYPGSCITDNMTWKQLDVAGRTPKIKENPRTLPMPNAKCTVMPIPMIKSRARHIACAVRCSPRCNNASKFYRTRAAIISVSEAYVYYQTRAHPLDDDDLAHSMAKVEETITCLSSNRNTMNSVSASFSATTR